MGQTRVTKRILGSKPEGPWRELKSYGEVFSRNEIEEEMELTALV
jgi:hypothetical protein